MEAITTIDDKAELRKALLTKLNELGIEVFKIPSGEITNLPYLRRIGSLAKQVILSTGVSTLKEVGDALAILVDSGDL